MAEFKDVLKDNLADDAKVDEADDTAEADGAGDATVAALEAELDTLKKELEALTGEKATLETKKADIEEQIKEETENYKKLEDEIAQQNKKYAEIIEKINKETEAMEESAAIESKHAVAVALNEYDPEVDGEWDSYIEKYMAKWQAELAESRGMLAGTDMNNRPKPWKKKCEFIKADVIGKLHMVLSNGVYIDTLNLMPRIQNRIRSLAAFDNPEFYK